MSLHHKSGSKFIELIERRWSQYNSLICVGLDPDYTKIPCIVKENSRSLSDCLVRFNCQIIDATVDLVCSFKPNIAFYEHLGIEGLQALIQTNKYIHARYPDIPVILDAKRADIESTNEGYVKAIFEVFEADAVTVHPYLGQQALKPFLEQWQKGIFVLCRTSNLGAGEFQDLQVSYESEVLPLYQFVALRVASKWNDYKNCGLVMGATYPSELYAVRKLVGDIPFLVPGIGAQAASIEATVLAGLDSNRAGMIINSARAIIFASEGPDFAEAARQAAMKLRDQVNKYRLSESISAP